MNYCINVYLDCHSLTYPFLSLSLSLSLSLCRARRGVIGMHTGRSLQKSRLMHLIEAEAVALCTSVINELFHAIPLNYRPQFDTRLILSKFCAFCTFLVICDTLYILK